MTTPEPSVREREAVLEKALNRAFQLGQTYGQQADSESYSQNAKSDVTHRKYLEFVTETLAALKPSPSPVVAAIVLNGRITPMFGFDLEANEGALLYLDSAGCRPTKRPAEEKS